MIDRFQSFTVLVTKINRSIRKIKTDEMAKYNLKSPHVSCLYYLYENDALTAKELSDICEEDKASISRSIDYLESNGYLTCESASDKRYKAPLYLTEKGQVIGKEISDKINAIFTEAGTWISPDERDNMYKSLSVISENLEKMHK